MTIFRAEFYEALQAMLRATDEPLLTDQLAITSEHNTRARILRHGIAVSAFAMLERYVKNVFEHMMKELAQSSILYNDLPDKLRRFIIVDSVAGLNNGAYFIRDEVQKINYIETHIASISLYKDNPPTYTHLGFSPTGSNVGHEDIKKGFAAFGVQDPWGKLTTLSASVGSAYLNLQDQYKTLASARNSSAHDPAGNIPTTTLQSNLTAVIALGISIDLLGHAVGKAAKLCTDKTKFDTDVNKVTPSIRFLDEQLDGKWAERASTLGKIIKRYPNRLAGTASASARTSNPAVVIRDTSGKPISLA
ncbi:HEPN domain-containing protein [Neorhizobium sp. CSC1952]|uniref:HEPN domain-containing protein n=1 Tax=Neorhizobium sp. CSC1952 TaxID=2978974 RepID=UPI0025A54F1E|nr:HEPN domain-containing protein [Rhizobium sp. CSC1952]WJR67814.1 HEPN domain-containing protein [Rhizobium sp. CSC1952]